MTGRRPAGVLGVVGLLLLALGAGGVLLFGSPGGFADVTAPMVDSNGNQTTETLTTTGDIAFTFRVVDIEACGLVCRNVTASVRNDGPRVASNVSVVVTILANGTAVWENTREMGSLSESEAYRTTERVTVTPNEAQAIQDNDGVVTIEVVIRHDEGSTTIERERSVL